MRNERILSSFRAAASRGFAAATRGFAAATRGFAAASAALLFQTSCTTTPTHHGAVTGGLIGAVVGGVAGDSGGDVAAGAAIGAIAGAVAGRIYENEQDRYRYDPYRHGGDTAQVQPLYPAPGHHPRREPPPRRSPPHPSPAPEPEPEYPWARKAGQPGHVYSPHPPHNLINVEGFRRGELAIDPTTDKVFRVP